MSQTWRISAARFAFRRRRAAPLTGGRTELQVNWPSACEEKAYREGAQERVALSLQRQHGLRAGGVSSSSDRQSSSCYSLLPGLDERHFAGAGQGSYSACHTRATRIATSSCYSKQHGFRRWLSNTSIIHESRGMPASIMLDEEQVNGQTKAAAWMGDGSIQMGVKGEPCRSTPSKVLIICDILNTGTWGSTSEASLEPFARSLEHSTVSEILKRQSSPETAMHFYKWASEQEGYVHDTFSSHILLGKLGTARKFAAMWNLLDIMHRKGCKMNSSTFSVFVRSYRAAGLFRQAVKAIDRFKKFTGQVNICVYVDVFRSLLDANCYELAEDVYQMMLKDGCKLDHEVWGTLIDEFGRHGKIYEAECCFREMIWQGLTPNLSVYNSLVAVYGAAGYTDKAVNVMLQMHERGCRPSTLTYYSVIRDLCRLYRSEDALKIFVAMKNDGFTPTRSVYACLLDGLFKEGKVLAALEIHEWLQEEDWDPGDLLYSIVVPGLCAAGQTEKALSLFNDVSVKSGTARTTVCNILLHKLCSANKLDEAEKVFSRILDGIGTPNVITFATMINGRIKAGKLDEARMLLVEMKQRGHTPNVYAYTPLIAGMCKSGRVHDAIILHEEMLEVGIGTNEITCNMLLTAMSSKGMVDKAVEICNYMVNKHYVIGVKTFYSLMEVLSKADRVDEANGLFKQFVRARCLNMSRNIQQALHALNCSERQITAHE